MFELAGDVELGEVAVKLLVVAFGSLTLLLFVVPLLSLCETVKLVAHAATRVVDEAGEAIEVTGEDERHCC